MFNFDFTSDVLYSLFTIIIIILSSFSIASFFQRILKSLAIDFSFVKKEKCENKKNYIKIFDFF